MRSNLIQIYISIVVHTDQTYNHKEAVIKLKKKLPSNLSVKSRFANSTYSNKLDKKYLE